MLQAKSAAMVPRRVRTTILQAEIGVDYSAKVSKKDLHVYYRGEIAVN